MGVGRPDDNQLVGGFRGRFNERFYNHDIADTLGWPRAVVG